jgi:SAM-dependent methyltransferase
MGLASDEKTMQLRDIVPEYCSSCFLVKTLFWDRIKYSIALGEISDDHKILDVGCGIGHLFSEIRKTNQKCRLIGIDFNTNLNSLHVADCEFRVEDVRRLSFKDNSFDTVFALDSLEHIKDVENAIGEIRRVLRPGGKFIITGPTESVFYKFCRFLIKGTFSEKEGPGTGVHYHNILTIDAKIEKLGFDREKCICLPRHSPLVLEKAIRYRNNKFF